jgi:hypothetical protein
MKIPIIGRLVHTLPSSTLHHLDPRPLLARGIIIRLTPVKQKY